MVVTTEMMLKAANLKLSAKEYRPPCQRLKVRTAMVPKRIRQ